MSTAKPIPDELLKQWRRLASELPQPSVVSAMMLALIDEIELERRLLRRVQGAVASTASLPERTIDAIRTLGVERDIDSLLAGKEFKEL